MDKPYKTVLSIVLAFSLILAPAFAEENTEFRFKDVPQGHWAEKAVHDLRSLGITEGIGNNKYGMGLEVKRSEFVKFLVSLMKWELITPEIGSFVDNMDPSKWYYSYIETAYRNGVISDDTTKFRPDDPITREEMAIMLVNTLGYGTLARQISDLGSDFNDVSNNTGYITIAKDFGIIKGVGNNQFKPDATAKREEAAVMMMRMYDKINNPVKELHAFYAIRSYPQMDFIPELDSVSFGWSRIEYDINNNQVVLNITQNNKNDFYIPPGFTEPVNLAKENNVSTQLMVFADNSSFIDLNNEKISLPEYILTQPELRKQAIALIAQQVNNTVADDISISFDGVVIDFEGLKGENAKYAFNCFLEELKQELDITGKKLIVAVHPERKPGQEYFDGYDYKTIGQIADKVILMAHDYYSKKFTDLDMKTGYTVTPLTPVDEVYYALKAITDEENGVENPEKIWLQISFDTVQWSLQNGEVKNREPFRPSYEQIYQRLMNNGEIHYSARNRNPYMEYVDETDQIYNIIWYEDSRSVRDKINLARMFGINGISLWRLGNIPDYEDFNDKILYLDIWQKLLEETRRQNQ